jgi:serine/threonine protein kinase
VVASCLRRPTRERPEEHEHRSGENPVLKPSAAPEFSLGLAGSVINSRYRVNAVSSMHRDVVLYSAEDVRNGRSIALKVLRDERAGDAAFVSAVREQAEALARAAHGLRGVQRVHDVGVTEAGQLFVALEWIEGATLHEVLDAGGALAVPTALRIAIRVGEALEALHHHRLLHGHFGPDSVLMVTDGEQVRLVGAELAAAYRTAIGSGLRDAYSSTYRAPEQIERGETTEATDVYALGMLLRQLCTAGRPGQPADAFAATPRLSSTIARIIATALEPRPEHRYPDISVMLNDIWGATAVVAEPAYGPRSAKVRGNPRRRARRRGRPFTLGMTAAIVTAGVAAVVVWIAALDRIVATFHGHTTPSPVTAVPVDRPVQPPAVPVDPEPQPSAPPVSASREPASVPVEPRVVGDERATEPPAPALARPLPAPPIPRQAPVAPAAASRLPHAVETRAPAESRAPVERRTSIDVRKSMEQPRGTSTERPERTSIEQPPAGVPTDQPARIERRAADQDDGSAAVDLLLKGRL